MWRNLLTEKREPVSIVSDFSYLFSLFEMSWREAIKKPTPKPAAPKPKFETKDDDWDTDLTYEVYLIRL